MGWKGKYFCYAHVPAESELARLKDDGFYVFGTNSLFSDNTEMHRKIREASSKKRTIYPYHKLTEGWIASLVLEAVLKATPWPASPEKIQKAMNNINVDMVGLKGGPIVWTVGNHYRTKTYYRVYRWDSRKNGIIMVKDWTALEVK